MIPRHLEAEILRLYHAEGWRRRKDGSQFCVEIGLNPMMTDHGPKVISSIADITKRKEIEKALSDSEQQMRLTFDSIRDHSICMLDAECTILPPTRSDSIGALSANTSMQRFTSKKTPSR